MATSAWLEEPLSSAPGGACGHRQAWRRPCLSAYRQVAAAQAGPPSGAQRGRADV